MHNHLGITQSEFETIVSAAIDALPPKYAQQLDNVAFVVADEPTPQQREKMRLQHYQTLFGLYEGIPQIARGSGYNFVLPDKITIFMLPLIAASQTISELKERTRKTVWHEVAHHFGLDHAQIDRLGGS